MQLPHEHIAVVNCDDVDFATTRQAGIAVDEKINVVMRALRVSSHKEERKDVIGILWVREMISLATEHMPLVPRAA